MKPFRLKRSSDRSSTAQLPSQWCSFRGEGHAHKWETTLNKILRIRGSSLHEPVFDLHYNARIGGKPGTHFEGSKIPYALVLTVKSPKMPDLYDRILFRYKTMLQVLQPVIHVPIRTTA